MKKTILDIYCNNKGGRRSRAVLVSTNFGSQHYYCEACGRKAFFGRGNTTAVNHAKVER